MSCLPNEYPRINDCEDPDESVIYSARYQKENKKEKKEKKEKEPPKLVCNKSAIVFAVPKFKVKAFYDPFDCLFCRGATTGLVFLLLIMACAYSIYFGI